MPLSIKYLFRMEKIFPEVIGKFVFFSEQCTVLTIEIETRATQHRTKKRETAGNVYHCLESGTV